ncbi:MAG: LuxR C-terminal-related transcriptional regulator [Blastococcus sp.]
MPTSGGRTWERMAVVVVCDDQLLFGEALAAALRTRGATAVAVGELAALSQLEKSGSVTHVVLGADPERPPSVRDLDGIRDACPDALLVCLTAEQLTEQDSRLVTAADVAVSKKQPLAEVVQAVLGRTSDGQRWGCPTRAVRPGSKGGARRQDSSPLSAQFLTVRERQVLRLLVVGESTQGIASCLGVSWSTARSHVQSVLGRLGVHSRVEAVRYALFHDLVDLETDEGSR